MGGEDAGNHGGATIEGGNHEWGVLLEVHGPSTGGATILGG